MEKLKKVRIPDQSFANRTAYLYAFLHSNRKLWDLQEFVSYAGRIATPERLKMISALSVSWNRRRKPR